jgi:hypothetical protein
MKPCIKNTCLVSSLLIPAFYLSSCMGPRNIYSVSPFVSPVALKKGATAIEANYFTHSRETNARDSTGFHDNCFGLILSHMLKEKVLVYAFMDAKKEKAHYSNSIDSLSNLYYNSGFDSSVVSGKRNTWGAGMEYFFTSHGKTIKSIAGSFAYQQMAMNDAGLLLQGPYHRFYKTDQLSFSLQGNLLFKINKSFNLAIVSRLTVLHSFIADTDYSSEEKQKTSLEDGKTQVFFWPAGLYADCRPFKKIPLYIDGQFFNDCAYWNRPMAKYEANRVFIKGTGVSVGLKYTFKLNGND